MQTTYELALNEFREAAAMVRRHFSATAEARELQIIANSQHAEASQKLIEAQTRLDAADKALTKSRQGEDTPADIDANRQPVMNGVLFVDEDPSGLDPDHLSNLA